MYEEVEKFFLDRGFPYHLHTPVQFFNMLSTAGPKYAVVVEVADLHVTRLDYFVGYYDFDDARRVASAIKRVRKYKVTSVSVFKTYEVK